MKKQTFFLLLGGVAIFWGILCLSLSPSFDENTNPKISELYYKSPTSEYSWTIVLENGYIVETRLNELLWPLDDEIEEAKRDSIIDAQYCIMMEETQKVLDSLVN